jgi:hypothetical protein
VPIDQELCRSIETEVAKLREEFGADPLQLQITPGVSYFEWNNPMFSLASKANEFIRQQNNDEVEAELWNPLASAVYQRGNPEQKQRLEKFRQLGRGVRLRALIQFVATLDLNARENELLRKALLDKGMFQQQTVAFGGVSLGDFETPALFLNFDSAELRDRHREIEHLVTHEFMHLHSRNGGFNDWPDEQDETARLALDEGVTELLARLVTYRRNISGTDNIPIMFGKGMPKYESQTQCANKLLGAGGHRAFGRAYFHGDWQRFNALIANAQHGFFPEDQVPQDLLCAMAGISIGAQEILGPPNDRQNIIDSLMRWRVLVRPGPLINGCADAFQQWQRNTENSGLTNSYNDPIRERLNPSQPGNFLFRLFSCCFGTSG